MVDQREEFVRLARQPDANVSELCRRFAISRKTGHKWLGRESFEDQPRRPRSCPKRTVDAVEAQVLQVRDRNPAWGGRKIARVLQRDQHIELAPSTVTSVLHRHCLNGQYIRLSKALVGQPVACRPLADRDGEFAVFFCHQKVDEFDLRQP